MKGHLIAQRYATAITSLETELDKKEDFNADLKALHGLIYDNPELIKSISSALIPLKKRIEIIEDFTSVLNYGDVWKNFLILLLKSHRMQYLPMIFEQVDEMLIAKTNRVKVQLKLARKPDNKTLSQIKSKIENIINKEIILEIVVDPEIIGGFVGETKSMTIDGSILHNLNRFKQTIIH